MPYKNKEKKKECSRRYYLKHKEIIKEKRKKNKKKIEESSRLYYQKHKESIKEKVKIYSQKNKGKVKIGQQKYRNTNRAELNEKKKEYYKENKKRFKKRIKISVKNYRKKYPDRYSAMSEVSHAVKTGKIQKGECYLKNETCYGKVDAHHQDYSKPLEIIWICRSHHKRLHYGSVKLDNI